MRSVPIIAKGVGGTAKGTDPLREALRKDQRRSRRATGRHPGGPDRPPYD